MKSSKSGKKAITLFFTSSKKQNAAPLIDLHYRNQDEPDFDCEFLHTQDYLENESMIDSETDEDIIDEYHDNDWDRNIYDPYTESAYF